MTKLTIDKRGRITLKRELQQHLGVKPGDRIELAKLPGGQISLRPVGPAGKIEAFFHALDGRHSSPTALSIHEMNDIGTAGWAGKYDEG